ncbi:uncharacterized protein Dana_GF26707 [Drosophila ananassae]|uniref:Uncharacterized protein n=1 Tax=Drosophila ananassae TaxID=7217 RepID=A0A0P8YB38_DROAN|nr:uncharacterized protein Dana_GF26707 [Drosophila ananassae]
MTENYDFCGPQGESTRVESGSQTLGIENGWRMADGGWRTVEIPRQMATCCTCTRQKAICIQMLPRHFTYCTITVLVRGAGWCTRGRAVVAAEKG